MYGRAEDGNSCGFAVPHSASIFGCSVQKGDPRGMHVLVGWKSWYVQAHGHCSFWVHGKLEKLWSVLALTGALELLI